MSSFLGSTHCVAMCGGIATSVNCLSGKSWLYHIGRLIGYVLLTTLLFYLGKSVLTQSQFTIFIFFLGLLVSLFILFQGGYLILQKRSALVQRFRISFLYDWYFGQLNKLRGLQDNQHAPALPPALLKFIIGLFNGFLPCGWLYAFVLLAITFSDLFVAWGVILCFWLGGLPAFYALPIVLQKIVPQSRQTVLGGLLIFFGLFTLLWRTMPVLNSVVAQACH